MPRFVEEAVQARIFELVTCSIQLDELRRAGRYPKFQQYLKPHRVGHMVNRLKNVTLFDDFTRTHDAADPIDSWMLNLTEKAQADYLVTGDKRAGPLSRESIDTARILTASTFRRDALQARR